MATQNTSSLISSIYKSKNVLLELMKTQGYNANDYAGFSINEVNSMKLNNQLDMMLERVKTDDEESNKSNKIYIRYYLSKNQLSKKDLQEIIDDLFNIEELLTTNDTLMIIVKDDANETLVNFIKHIWEQDNVFVIVQSLKRSQFNILEHNLVPPHRVLSNTEIVQIKQKYNIMNDNQFPIISRFDPVAQSIGIRPGQVCEIIRPSKTAIIAPYYRVCV
jgi:DNA-directed RNA polymerase subunit H (RpoH/RPB5)